MAEECWEFDFNLYQLFVDFKQAYGSIDSEKRFTILFDFNIAAKLVRFVKAKLYYPE